MATSVAPPVTPSAPKPTSMTPMPPPSNLFKDSMQDIPIFLRKTYHMIDTCDPTIACWSDDGETFVVKDPIKFERSIIPQFFKHSKFSSFVRQLNFYAFRKIKYADTIRIDPKLEAETANYWRFRHEKFQRGHPEWLTEIKRMNGQKHQQQKAAAAAAAADPGNAAVAAKPVLQDQEAQALKSEVSSLKQRIEDMTKNIDELTSMVRKVTVSAPAAKPEQPLSATTAAPMATVSVDPALPSLKRKKTEAHLMPVPDAMLSGAKAMDLDDMLLPPSIPSPLPASAPRETSATSDLSDEGFVNELLTVFKTDGFEFEDVMSDNSLLAPEPPVPTHTANNRPDPELMEKLSDVLSLLPRDIQEMIVDRLIEAITSPKQVQENIMAAKALNDQEVQTNDITVLPAVPQSPTHTGSADEESSDSSDAHVGLPLAAATLAALLTQYTQASKGTKRQERAHKTLPVIPVHA